MEKFIPKPSSFRIVDENFGYCFITEGTVGNKGATLIADYGLGREARDAVVETAANLPEIQADTEGIHEGAEKILVPSAKFCEGDLLNRLCLVDYEIDPMARKSISRYDNLKEFVIPTSRKRLLTENIQRHYESKLQTFVRLLDSDGQIYRNNVFYTTKKDTPFFIVEARLTKEARRLQIEETFNKILAPGNTLSRLVSEGKTVQIAFFPSAEYLNRLSLWECPSFPQEKIDNLQEIEIKVESLDSAKLVRVESVIIDSGAAASFVAADNSTVRATVPMSSYLGGVRGSAFETRLSFIERKLREVAMEPKSFKILEKKRINTFEKAKPVIMEDAPEDFPQEGFAFFKKLCTIQESEAPLLFNNREKEEIFLRCESKNYLGVKKGIGTITFYHGVANGGSINESPIRLLPNIIKRGSRC